MRLPRLFILALLIVLPAADFAAESPARYTLPSLETATPPDPSILPAGTGTSHGGYYILTAVNWYAARMHPGKPNPPIEPKELRALAVAALQSECDMYIVDSGRPALEFVESDTGAHWPMAIENARGTPRAYVGALDAMAQAAIEWGKRHEVKPNQAVGQRVYRTVAALGQALRKWPGCPEDIELGIRLESEALYQLESLYERNNSLAKLRFCRQYLTEIRQLAARQAAAASESAPGLDVLRHAAEFRKQWLAGLVVSAIAFLGFGATLASKKGPLSMRVGGAAISTVGLVLTIIAYTEWNGRQKLLESSGRIQTDPMDTDFPADRVLPPGTGLGHGGYFFMAALNHYNARRIPMLKKRGLKPIATEPEIVKDELLAIKSGALQSDCTLYLDQPLSLVGDVGAKPWHMTPATNFMEIRPYVAPMRAMAQAALNHARNEEPMHAADAAERIYLHVAKIGRCLRMHPGCLQDIELGLEIELNGLHYLEVSLKHRGLFRRLMDCEDYAASVKRLETAVRRKYSQLGNVEAAKWVLRHDREPIWRSEAGFALVSALHLHEMSLIEQRTCRVALHEMLRDPVKSVRAAGVTLQSMPETEFVAPSGQPPAGGESAGL